MWSGRSALLSSAIKPKAQCADRTAEASGGLRGRVRVPRTLPAYPTNKKPRHLAGVVSSISASLARRSPRSLVPARAASLPDLPQRCDTLAVRRDPGAREPPAPRPAPAPDLHQDPVPEQVSGQVRLVVPGIRSVDPPFMLRSLFHGSQHTPGGGSFREPLAASAPEQKKPPSIGSELRVSGNPGRPSPSLGGFAALLLFLKEAAGASARCDSARHRAIHAARRRRVWRAAYRERDK
jgi:hypothetical protein